MKIGPTLRDKRSGEGSDEVEEEGEDQADLLGKLGEEGPVV